MFSPALNTATLRRQYRRDVRNRLGTSSDRAPEAGQVFRAIPAMQNLVTDASNGHCSLVLVDRMGRALSPYEADRSYREDRVFQPALNGGVAFDGNEIEQLREAVKAFQLPIHPAIRTKLGL